LGFHSFTQDTYSKPKIQFALLNIQEENKVMENPLPNVLSEVFGTVL